ncbi:cytidylate kinase family protein [Luteococcus sp. H138]|uniref:cytidylate kinase-like family protein n=1 Tax=unclassified Luteococcus TaxID=2639923 RepID=UPI00313CD7DE
MVVIDSQYCAMGRWISVIVGQQAGMHLIEGPELCALSGQGWLTPEVLAEVDATAADSSPEELRGDGLFLRVSAAVSDAVRVAATEGDCLIHERAGAHLLAERDDVFSTMVRCSDPSARIPRARLDPHFPELLEASEQAVRERISREDRSRANYHDAISSTPWGGVDGYDLVLDSGRISREKSAEILTAAISPTGIDEVQAQELVSRYVGVGAR